MPVARSSCQTSSTPASDTVSVPPSPDEATPLGSVQGPATAAQVPLPSSVVKSAPLPGTAA
ncbi:hypothetical protein DEJ23_09380 [Curtobacterium sp. MCSS17_008]|nr:hypothetical protein DEJ23_09380 [Curtobacterium sp. MCSS17_008]